MPEGAGTTTNGDVLARTAHRRIWLHSMFATTFIGAVASVIYLVVGPFNFGDRGTAVATQVLVAAWTYLAVASVFEYFRMKRTFRPVRTWLVEGRAPTPQEWRATQTQARRQAFLLFPQWLVIIGGGMAYFIMWSRIESTTSEQIRTGASAFVVAVNACVLAFLLADRAMRPVLARANELDRSLVPGGMGLSGRLALSLIAVAGTPMASVINSFLGATPERAELSGIVALVAVGGGSLMAVALMLVVGRTLTDPLQRLRRAQAEVEAGRFDRELPVDERGEIGLVQAGFNAMVAGLRERERMRDVFGRHVGADVARLAMETEFGSGGQQCAATVMFVDIIGSTGLAQRKDPDAVVEILNRFFDAVVRVVGAEGGYVNKFHGDGALCIFGAPIPQEDHAARGLRAARELARALAPMGDVAAAIGVSSGIVVAGNVGAIDRYEFTVIGDPVNEASRLSDEAKLHPSHVLVSDRTIASAGDAVRGWIRGEAIALRGRSQPTITYSPYD
jgi:adenylate cyclase